MSNKILELRKDFESDDYSSNYNPFKLPPGQKVSLDELIKLKDDLIKVRDFWEKQTLKINPLISVHYKRIIVKSNRIKSIFEHDFMKNNQRVVGCRFSDSNPSYHIITYCITNSILQKAIKNLENCIDYLKHYSYYKITQEDINSINKNFNTSFVDLTKTRLINTILDVYFIKSFQVDEFSETLDQPSIISIYDTNTKASDIFKQLDIEFSNASKLDEITFFLNRDQINKLVEKAPYLIAMGINDISYIEPMYNIEAKQSIKSIQKPTNEPTIGVIDTLFDKENTYFSDWVEFENRLDENIPIKVEDYFHGTEVSSIIVDGHRLNPELDDGCGHFKVRHFGVAKQGSFSSFTVLKDIEKIIKNKQDIKVWNLSLGSPKEINQNFISIEASFLDKIQAENNVIFVIAGTNGPSNKAIKIGLPADSINSLVVNSVDFDNKPADYSRTGPVLSFFNKPDISYYGGTYKKGIQACSTFKQIYVTGTSYAAPWISRKLCYLIEVIGLSREVAKALIIHSATSWSNQDNINLLGYGVVPIHIKDILESPANEIKFIIEGKVNKYETFNYTLPIPLDKNKKHPFVAKLTMCYFPSVSRNQGVDYTNTEMDIKFGKIISNKDGVKLEPINNNKQSYDDNISIFEKEARKKFKKWNNTKHIQEDFLTATNKNKRPRISKQEQGYWGFNIITKERLEKKKIKNLKYGVVVSLKSVDNNNYYNDFIKNCQFRGWTVNKINLENMIDVYNRSQADIKFE
ncbi:S8 family peptidase [Mycoplasma mycoides subsp. capri]|uniref:S8 family peptidase n=1 Tax=Mycoplasma mycoides TaxID=2102 RepID=UPI001AFA23E3|nr:S8 family peptidase [Mycoplasma mycoides subsp. capri]